MNADLENTLKELGPEFRGVVDRLCAAQEVEPRVRPVVRPGWWRRAAVLVAASLLVVVGFTVVTSRTPQSVTSEVGPYTLALQSDDRAISELVRTQRADGSWENDFLTRQNAAALRGLDSPDGRIAYKRAVRYLRSKGLSPLSDAELRSRGERWASTAHRAVVL